MRRLLIGGIAVALAIVMILTLNGGRPMAAADAKGPMIVHNVYFSLKDNSPQAKEKLVVACKKHLTKHPGEVFFAAGVLAEEFNRPVNDRDFDVGLHIVFADKKAHDTYQDAERHQKFIDENKDSWKKVRVFDSAAQP